MDAAAAALSSSKPRRAAKFTSPTSPASSLTQIPAAAPIMCTATAGRRTVITKAKPRDGGAPPPVDLAIPVFGYQPPVSTDRGFGFSRMACAGRCRLGRLPRGAARPTRRAAFGPTPPTGRPRTKIYGQERLREPGPRKKPKGRPRPEAIRRANNAKSKIRSRIEPVFAAQKDRIDLFIGTIGLARATMKSGLANLVYNREAALRAARRDGPTLPSLAAADAAPTVRVRRNPATAPPPRHSPAPHQESIEGCKFRRLTYE
jgi:hypothetical protein